MKSISKTLKAIESHDDVERAEIEHEDGDSVVISAFVDEMTDEFEAMVRDDLGLQIDHSKYVVFGHEVTIA